MGRSSEKSSLLASTSGGSNNGRDHQRDAHRGGGFEEEEKESTFQYLSSIVVSALALTGAVVGVASVWQRCQNGNCNPGSFLLPGDHRYVYASPTERVFFFFFFFFFRVQRVLSRVVFGRFVLFFFFFLSLFRVRRARGEGRFIFIAKLTTLSTIILSTAGT
jgi:hypothetical protein